MPLSPADVHVTEFRRQDLLRSAATARLVASGSVGTRRLGAAGVLRALVSALGRAAALVPDSRETLRCKEQDLAALGVTWASDPAADRALARGLLAARARREARRLPVLVGEPLEEPSAVHRARAPRLRRALDAAFAR